MYTILNQKGEKVAYIQNMMIMDMSQEQVLGILIGDCFFGKKNNALVEQDYQYLKNKIK